MQTQAATAITGAVEGDLDEAMLRRIATYAGLTVGIVHGRKGKPFLLRSLNGYNNAARFSPWFVLVDLNGDCDCAPVCLHQWLPDPSRHMCFRIAVRAIESWVMSDRDRVARWLGISRANVPAEPDHLEDPKRELINLARRSRRRGLREDLVPREGSGRAVGPLYAMRMSQFIQDDTHGWRPEQAIRISDSLARCIVGLRQLA